MLGAAWYSWGNYWSFHAGSSPSAPADSVDLFKSLARQAASGVGSPRGSDSWMDWLDTLRCAKDEDTGKLLYAEDSSGSCAMSERELSRLQKSGETIPAGGLIEFVATKDGGIERRTYWDTSRATIRSLFKNSANHCLRLRPLAPDLRLSQSGPEPKLTPDTKDSAAAKATNNDRAERSNSSGIGRNINRLRKECGWSFDDLAKATNIDKKLILGHVNKGKGAHPKTLETYASVFTEKLGRTVTVAELEGGPQ